MANYRRELSKFEQENLMRKYKKHPDAEGGIFAKDKRRKLLGIKLESRKQHEDTPNFWCDVRTTVRSGLKDLELFFEVAHPNQIKIVLYDAPLKEQMDFSRETSDYNKIFDYVKTIPTLQKTLESLFMDYKKKHTTHMKDQEFSYLEPIEKDDSWRALLVHDIIRICTKFLVEHNLVSSKAHQRVLEEFEDMMNVEISRTPYLSRFQRTKGFV